MDFDPSRSQYMPIASAVITASRVVLASYRILATSILGYYLIKETIRRERNERLSKTKK